jgi:hypothetical protein
MLYTIHKTEPAAKCILISILTPQWLEKGENLLLSPFSADTFVHLHALTKSSGTLPLHGQNSIIATWSTSLCLVSHNIVQHLHSLGIPLSTLVWNRQAWQLRGSRQSTYGRCVGTMCSMIISVYFAMQFLRRILGKNWKRQNQKQRH